MVARDDQHLDACVADLIQIARHEPVAQQLAVLCQVARDEHQLGTRGDDGVNHGLEDSLALDEQFAVRR